MRVDIEAIKRRFKIIGNNAALLRAVEVAYQVASTDLAVLVTGESGSGKEFFPQIVHQYGIRKHGRYVAVNCAAIPEGTLDSELFGHIKGSFTGALENREGYFEVANRGTIFLDEIGELPLTTQARLLRILETGEFYRVGSSTPIQTDIRIVAATNVNLETAIREGKFREDLYYRLSTVPIRIPPLRERGDDVLLLFRWFAGECAEKYNMPPIRLQDARAEAVLLGYGWPGNVRELKNMAERISVIETEREITVEILQRYIPQTTERHLPALYRSDETRMPDHERELLYGLVRDLRGDVDELRQVVFNLMQQQESAAVHAVPNEHANPLRSLAELSGQREDRALIKPPIIAPIHEEIPVQEVHNETVEEVPRSIADMEEEMIRHALQKHNGHRKQAAEELGISLRTLYRKLQEYDIQ
ncbi:MAG: sigma-54 interaction domain-containing protein [Bacteroides sp.]